MQGTEINSFEDNKYFKGGCWGRYLEIIPQTCRYAEGCILVTGDKGTGKSTLIQALNENISSDYTCLNLSGNKEEDPTTLVQKIATIFETLDLEKDIVILVDDADNYQEQTLISLLELCATSEQYSKVKLVLFAQCDFEPLLLSIRDKFGIEGALHHFDIAPFSATELEAYLWFLWKEQATEKSPSLSSDIIDKINLYSSGVVGKSRVIAKKALQGEKIAMNSIVQDDNETRTSNTLVGGFVIFAAVLVLFFSLSLKDNDTKSTKVAIKVNSDLNKDDSAVLLSNSDIEKPATEKETLIKSEPNLEIVASEDSTHQTYGSLDVSYSQSESTKPKTELHIADLSSHSISDAQVKDITNPSTSEVKRTNAFRSDEEHLLAMPKGKYALQIVANTSKERMRDFIKHNNLEKHARVYESTMRDKSWFVLIYGEYDTVAEAKQQISNLGKNIVELQPWVRNFDSIQNSIIKARERRS